MQVKGLNQSILALPSWSQFLMRSTLVGAAILLSSALMMAIAANWLDWPKVARVALLELTVLVLVCCAAYLAKREPKGWSTAYSLSSLVQMLAAISVGGLLALIGQSYQTGADPWQLFALWAVLIMPWAFGLGSLFIILLVLVLTNLALFLFLDVGDNSVWSGRTGLHFDYLWLVVLNGVWLALSFRGRRIADPHQLWYRSSLLLLVGSAVMWCLVQTHYEWAVLTAALILLGLWALYSRRHLLVWNLAVFYSAFFVVLLFWLIHSLEWLESWYELLFFPMLLVALLLIRDLRLTWRLLQLAQSKSSTQQVQSTEPWFLRCFVLLAQCIVFVLFAWLILAVWRLEPHHLAYVYLPIVFVLLLFLLRAPQLSPWLHDLPLFLFSSSVFFMAVLLFDQTDLTWVWVSLFVAYCAVLYGLSTQHYLLRLGSALTAIGVVLYGAAWFFNAYYWTAISRVIWGLSVAWLVASLVLTRWPLLRQRWQPIWWALTAWLIVHGLLQDSVDTVWNSLMAVAVPVLTVWCLRRTQSTALYVGGFVIGTVLSVAWLFSAPLVNLAVALWILSYAWQQGRLLWFALTLLLAALGHYYYFLDVSLIRKAFDLSLGALLLGAAAGLLHRSSQSFLAQPKTAPAIHSSWWFKSVVLYGGLALIVTVTVWDVVRKERLLAYGQEIILALAPVDPRSLMQGDYMALRFELGAQVASLARPQAQAIQGRELIAYLQPQPQAPALLLALESPSTGQFWRWEASSQTWHEENKVIVADATVYPLRLIYKMGSWLPNGIDAWFFPEGSAQLYEQARYGVFKVNSRADALLHSLRQ